MPDTGKIDRAFFEEFIAARLGATRADVRKGPTPGVDFGVVDAGEHAIAVATDPISILPQLGFERAGRFAVQFVLTDVAVSGLSPTHLSISLALPPELTDEEFAGLWQGIHDECEELGVQIVTGHTARYEGCQFPWVGHGTAFAIGSPADLIYPDGATAGDQILVTNGPAVEVTALFASLFPDQIPVSETVLEQAQALLAETGAVRPANVIADIDGVTAIHDATEGGLVGAFHEMARSADVSFAVETDPIPIRPGIREISDALEMDPWRATTAGTLVITVAPDAVDAVVAALAERGTPVGVAGVVNQGEGVQIDGERSTPPSGDSSWPVYERLFDGAE